MSASAGITGRGLTLGFPAGYNTSAGYFLLSSRTKRVTSLPRSKSRSNRRNGSGEQVRSMRTHNLLAEGCRELHHQRPLASHHRGAEEWSLCDVPISGRIAHAEQASGVLANVLGAPAIFPARRHLRFAREHAARLSDSTSLQSKSTAYAPGGAARAWRRTPRGALVERCRRS